MKKVHWFVICYCILSSLMAHESKPTSWSAILSPFLSRMTIEIDAILNLKSKFVAPLHPLVAGSIKRDGVSSYSMWLMLTLMKDVISVWEKHHGNAPCLPASLARELQNPKSEFYEDMVRSVETTLGQFFPQIPVQKLFSRLLVFHIAISEGGAAKALEKEVIFAYQSYREMFEIETILCSRELLN